MIISVTSSKGGSGKTTLNAILGANLYSGFSKKVWFVDLDPQMSLRKKRQMEVKNFNEKKYAINSNMFLAAKNNHSRFGSAFCTLSYIDLATHTFEEIKRYILKEKKEKGYDIVILDFPGSLTINATTYKLLSLLDFVFIPMYVDYNTYVSSRDFYFFIEKQRINGKLKCIPYVFFNRFTEGRGVVNAKNFEVLSSYLDSMGVRRLNYNVGQSIDFESYSTLEPTSNIKISRWIDEIGAILKDVDEGTYKVPIPERKSMESPKQEVVSKSEEESVNENHGKENESDEEAILVEEEENVEDSVLSDEGENETSAVPEEAQYM